MKIEEEKRWMKGKRYQEEKKQGDEEYGKEVTDNNDWSLNCLFWYCLF